MEQEIVKIDSENLEIANTYLQTSDIDKTCRIVGIPRDQVVEVLDKPEVKRYLDRVYFDAGYRNRTKMAELFEEVIESKLEEARDSEIYSKKDLVDILALYHKVIMEQAKLAEPRQEKKPEQPTNQFNTQINTELGGENTQQLIRKLLKLTEE